MKKKIKTHYIMPRRNNNHQLREVDIGIPPPQIVVQNNAPFFAADYLRKNHYEMKKDLKKEIECAVCLEKICCDKCYTLLTCGHEFCLRCIMRCPHCPLCRSHQENSN